MKRLIAFKNPAREPSGSSGLQRSSIVFWQKTGIFCYADEHALSCMAAFIDKHYGPSSVNCAGSSCFIQFDNDEAKQLFLTIKKEGQAKRGYLYGLARTDYADAEFHIKVLEILNAFAKKTRCKFYVDDASGFLEHRSKQQLKQYIEQCRLRAVESKDRFRKAMSNHQNRPLDIDEILSREKKENVVVDAYEYFMRQSGWKIDERFHDTVKNFLLCVLYDGEIGNNSLSRFYARENGALAGQIADALHKIGAAPAEALLRKSFSFFPDGIVPEKEEEREECLGQIDKQILNQLDAEVYQTDIYSFCYRYLMSHKEEFIQAAK